MVGWGGVLGEQGCGSISKLLERCSIVGMSCPLPFKFRCKPGLATSTLNFASDVVL